MTMAEPMADGCPWSGWTPPNVDWCEEQLCAWIVNPADSWSNLAYIVVGIAMWRIAARDPDSRRALFGPAGCAVGVFSFVYHASYTYFFQFFDFVGMFVFCFTVIAANTVRMGWVSTRGQWAVWWGGVVFFSALVPLVSETRMPIQALVAFLIVVVILQEIVIAARRSAADEPIEYRFFFVALALLAVAGSSSLADFTRTICDPQNHWLSGHALWHVLTAAALFALFTFHGRLPRDPGIGADA